MKLIAFMAAILGAALAWKSGVGHHVGVWLTSMAQSAGLASPPAPDEFIALPMPDGMSERGIIIFAPKNCPSDAAQRARGLADFLTRKGIDFERSQSARYSVLASQEDASRVASVLKGQVPIVYVNGRAKANPTPEEVEAEYRRYTSK